MVDLLIIAGIISLATSIIGVLIALKLQSRVITRTGVEHAAWKHSQEAHQQLWEVKQRKHTFEFEHKLNQRVQQIQDTWQEWEARDEVRLAKLTLEQKLAYLPRVEDVPVASKSIVRGEQSGTPGPHEQPPSFYRANLSERDLSHRYLGYADLREAQLVGTNLYMADLTGACLTGANLKGANLAGANLSGADLRGAILKGANFLVADLHNAVLNSADLLDAHNLTRSQLNTAIYSGDVQADAEYDITLPRMPVVRLEAPMPSITSSSVAYSPTFTPITDSIPFTESASSSKDTRDTRTRKRDKRALSIPQ